jgi:hypothetical protein
MHREAGVPRKPLLHLRGLVSGIIVGDQMQVEIAWRLAIYLLEDVAILRGYGSPRCA